MRSSCTGEERSTELLTRRHLDRRTTSASASQFQTFNSAIPTTPCRRRSNMSSVAVRAPSSLVLRAAIAFVLLSACGGWMLSGARFADVFRARRGETKSTISEKDGRRAAPPWDKSISEMQDAVNAFEARDYVPPVWARNAHLHTIVASGDMEKKLLGDRTPLGYWRERWPTPDGDFVDIDWLPADEPEKDVPNVPNVPKGNSWSHFSTAESNDEEAAAPAGAEKTPLSMDVQSAINARLELTPQVENREQLKEMADLAERADGNSLGIGHPAAPEPIHEEDPSWMSERSRGKGGQGRGGTRRLVLVLHGLEGSSTAPLTKRFSSVYTRNGFDVAAVNFRGCSGEISNFPVGYHLGFTADLLHVIEEIHRKFPDTWDRIYLSGFSLGGNVIIKFLGEQGDRARDLGIYGAAVACVPFEPKIAAEKLEKDPIGRYVYMPVFMGWMNTKALAHAKAFPDKLSLETVQSVKTFTEFNSRITAPVFDFSSPDEFYDDVNASNYLSRVRVPLMVVNARDDPFIDGNSLPQQERVGDAPVRLVYHNYGGHCGFMSGVLSNVLQGKTPEHLRTWGRSWGGSWVPWAARGDPETLPEEFHAENAAPVGAAATAAAAAAPTAVLAPPDASPYTESVSSDATGGVAGGVEGSGDAIEEDSKAERGGATLKEGRWLPTELARFVTHLEESLHKDGRSERPGARAEMEARATSELCAPEPSLKR